MGGQEDFVKIGGVVAAMGGQANQRRALSKNDGPNHFMNDQHHTQEYPSIPNMTNYFASNNDKSANAFLQQL